MLLGVEHHGVDVTAGEPADRVGIVPEAEGDQLGAFSSRRAWRSLELLLRGVWFVSEYMRFGGLNFCGASLVVRDDGQLLGGVVGIEFAES